LSRPFRFGFQLSGDHADDPIGAARRAEELGFDVVLASDHVGPGLAPMTTLAAIASATERIRLGTFVLNHDMRNPVQLAWEAVSLDRLSGGRFELGLGAGHTPQEYAATGISMDPPAVRKARLVESLRVLRPLLARRDHIDADGDAGSGTVGRPVQERVPLLVGGNGERLLGAAGELADIIGLQGLGRTLEDGHRHEVKWTASHLDEQIAQVRAGAGDRFADLELNALVQVFSITADRDAELREITDRWPTLSVDDASVIPYLMIGSIDEIVGHVRACRDRWGITYFVVRALDEFAPVIDAVRATSP
jgi:probable F420-dependent oxidoreductase